MTSVRKNQDGMGTLEIILVVFIVAVIAFVGWYVYHTTKNSNKALDQASSTSQNAGPRFKSDKKDSQNNKSSAGSSSSTTKNSSSSSSSKTTSPSSSTSTSSGTAQ